MTDVNLRFRKKKPEVPAEAKEAQRPCLAHHIALGASLWMRDSKERSQ